MKNPIEAIASWAEKSPGLHGVRDATRFALQSAVAAALTFAFMEAFGLPEKFVAVISAVLVVQPSVGGTASAGWNRLIATLLGSAIGLTCLLVLPQGAGTAAALALAMLVMNAVAAFHLDWRYGVVAAVALALGDTDDTLRTALDRSAAIGVGVVIGIIGSFLVWPDSARKRVLRHTASALRAVADRLGSAVQQAEGKSGGDDEKAASRFHDNLQHAREASASTSRDKSEAAQELINNTERLYNSVLWVNRVASHGLGAPLEETLQDELGVLRESARDAIMAIINGTDETADAIKRYAKCLSEMNDKNSDNHDEGYHALLFALHEIEENMRSVDDAFGDMRDGNSSRAGQVASMAREAVPLHKDAST